MGSHSNALKREKSTPPEWGMVVGDVAAVRAKLARLGWSSLASWSRERGYELTTVRNTIVRWGQRTDRRPHGGIARVLMSDLRQTIQARERPAQAGDRRS